MMTPAERAHIYELVHNVIDALCADHENGVRWLNEKAAADFAYKHPHTVAALAALTAHVHDWGPK